MQQYFQFQYMFYRVKVIFDNRYFFSCDDWGVSIRVLLCGVVISFFCGYIVGYSYFYFGWYRRVENL